MKEYDIVELIVNKQHYNAQGVFKGMFGVVMCEKNINGKWLVTFEEFYTGKDIAQISVLESDLKVHEFVPPECYPKPVKEVEYIGFKKNDIVKVLSNNYISNNVKFGMKGIIVTSKSSNGKWRVLFTNKETCETIAKIEISEKDMKVFFRG